MGIARLHAVVGGVGRPAVSPRPRAESGSRTPPSQWVEREDGFKGAGPAGDEVWRLFEARILRRHLGIPQMPEHVVGVLRSKCEVRAERPS